MADPDKNFREFSKSALEGHLLVRAAGTAMQALVDVLRWKPDLLLISPDLPGRDFPELVGNIRRTDFGGGIRIFQLTPDDQRPPRLRDLDGVVERSFVPQSFTSQVLQLLSGAAKAEGGIYSWIPSLKSEIITALRITLGMMTGGEPAPLQPGAGRPAFDCFGRILMRGDSPRVTLDLRMHCGARAAKALVDAMLGGAEDDVDESFQAGGISEILNVIARRVKASCEKRKIPIKLGLPETSAAPFRSLGESLHEESFDFVWREEHPFQLQCSASRDAPA